VKITELFALFWQF